MGMRPEFEKEDGVKFLHLETNANESGFIRISHGNSGAEVKTISIRTDEDIDGSHPWWVALTKEESMALVREILQTWREIEDGDQHHQRS